MTLQQDVTFRGKYRCWRRRLSLVAVTFGGAVPGEMAAVIDSCDFTCRRLHGVGPPSARAVNDARQASSAQPPPPRRPGVRHEEVDRGRGFIDSLALWPSVPLGLLW
ncbi:hypothetical protein ACOMHN_061499 [Nucella lapillus]